MRNRKLDEEITDIHEIAAYYLKNIILLQAFPDGNHRTALYAVELFLKINGYDFDYSAEEAYEFRRELTELCHISLGPLCALWFFQAENII